MRVLGIDCGSHCTGYGVIDTDGRTHRLVSAGVIRTQPIQPFGQRLRAVGDGLRTVIRQYTPQIAAVEDVFHAANIQSALRLAHVRGAVLLVLAEYDIPCGEYAPLAVKTSVVGYGRAEKRQVELMVRSLLQLTEPISPADVSDALAVAICHVHHTFSSQHSGVGS